MIHVIAAVGVVGVVREIVVVVVVVVAMGGMLRRCLGLWMRDVVRRS